MILVQRRWPYFKLQSAELRFSPAMFNYMQMVPEEADLVKPAGDFALWQVWQSKRGQNHRGHDHSPRAGRWWWDRWSKR